MKNKLLPLLLLPLLVASCSKSDSETATPSGPKEYQVEYRITAAGYTTARSIIYADASNTQVTDENIPLPKTYTFKRTMKSQDVVRVGAFPAIGTTGTSVTCTILLDGKEVATDTETGPDPQPVALYQLP